MAYVNKNNPYVRRPKNNSDTTTPKIEVRRLLEAGRYEVTDGTYSYIIQRNDGTNSGTIRWTLYNSKNLDQYIARYRTLGDAVSEAKWLIEQKQEGKD